MLVPSAMARLSAAAKRAEAAEPTRRVAGHKRQVSAVGDEAGSSQGATQQQGRKRPKRVVADDHEQLVAETEAAAVQGHESVLQVQHAVVETSQLAPFSLSFYDESTQQTVSDTQGEAGTQVAFPDPLNEQAAARFERTTAELTHRTAQAEYALASQTTHVQNLAITAGDDRPDAIFQEFHAILYASRGKLEVVYPGSTSGVHNGDVIRELGNRLVDLKTALTEEQKRAQLFAHDTVALQEKTAKYSREIAEAAEATAAYKAEKEDDVAHLQSNVDNLESTTAKLREEIASREAELRQHANELDNRSEVIEGLEITTRALEEERANHELQITRLKDALEKDHREIGQLTETITSLEAAHKEEVVQLADALGHREAELAEEAGAREAAEEDCEQSRRFIEGLEAKIEAYHDDLDAFKEQASRVQKDWEAEKTGRTAAEAEGTKRAERILALETAAADDEACIRELRHQADELNKDLVYQQGCSQSTQEDLNQTNKKVEDVEAALQRAGIQANELRGKLFHVQQDKNAAIRTLEETVRDRECALQDEADRRTDAEQLATDRDARIAQLADELQDANGRLVASEQDRLDALTDHEAQLRDEIQRYRALEQSTDSQIAELESAIQALEDKVAERNNALEERAALLEQRDDAIDERDVRIADMEELAAKAQDEFATHIVERDVKIQDTKDQLAQLLAAKDQLEEEKLSLERRVESEATELLDMNSFHQDSMDTLEDEIAAKDRSIAEKMGTIAQQTEQIAVLAAERDHRGSEISTLRAQVDELQRTLENCEEDARYTFAAMQEGQRSQLAQSAKLSEAFQQRSEGRLLALQVKDVHAKVKAAPQSPDGDELKKVAAGYVTKTQTRKTRSSARISNGVPKSNGVKAVAYTDAPDDADNFSDVDGMTLVEDRVDLVH